jgi:hypothetical protein
MDILVVKLLQHNTYFDVIFSWRYTNSYHTNWLCYWNVSSDAVIRINPTISTGWKARCAEYFPYSTYFEGIKSASAAYCSVANSLEDSSENGIVANAQMKSADGETCTLNGTVHIVDELSNLSIR